MKRLICALLVLALCGVLPACAEDWTTVDHKADRKITPAAAEENAVTEGVSPVTGRTLSEIDVPEGYGGQAATGRYMPVLVQIDNADGGILYRPWGLDYADIVYELPLYSNGPTRLTYLYSDVMPDAAGPVRSARISHAWLRQEWNCAFVHVGGQEKEGSNVMTELGRTGGLMGKTRFDGNANEDKPWMKYIKWDKTKASSHNVTANVAGLCGLVPENIVPTGHAYLFTDAVPQGDAAAEVQIDWNNETFNSLLRYDETTGRYLRFMYDNKSPAPYTDRVSGVQAGFENVIIQFTNTWYNGGDSAAPVTDLIGEGNADFFQGGVHRSGYWKRADSDSRTVYYDADGREIEMLRGRKLIVCLPLKGSVRYR